jgi:hypothetical protein
LPSPVGELSTEALAEVVLTALSDAMLRAAELVDVFEFAELQTRAPE